MNDLIENDKIVFQRVIFGNLDEDKENGLFAEEEMHRYQQISFSQDRFVDDKIPPHSTISNGFLQLYVR